MTNNKDIEKLLKFSIINLDKPSGPASFLVSDNVREMLGLNKTSHFGTLDPQVSGVLPIALGRACRLSDFFMHANKKYVGIMRMHKPRDISELDKIIKKFTGVIKQLPPIRSNVKRAVREREVIYFNVIEQEGNDILFETEVQAGTYIRKICDDIGKEIGGAHMLELRRTKAGIFDEKNSITLYDLEKAVNKMKEKDYSAIKKILIPADKAIKEIMPSAKVKSSAVKKLLTGKPLMRADLSEKEPNLLVYAIFDKEKFIGVVKKTDEGDIIARSLFVYN